MKTTRFLLFVSLLTIGFWLSGCDSPAPTPSPAEIQTAIAETLTAAPTETETPTEAPEDTPQPSPPSAPSPSPTPSRPIDGEVSVAFLNMRAGPSTFFEVVGTFEQGVNVVAIARVFENTWVEVEIEGEDDELVTGWMFAEYIDLDEDITLLPLASFPEDQIITGIVQDENGDPIEGVVIATLYSTDDGDLRVDSTSNAQGRFTVFLPEDLFGILDVQVISPLCDSGLMDEDCQITSHILLNERVFVSIPQERQEITFIYETASYTLTGTVVNGNNQPVEEINIQAVRDDGAFTFGFSGADGEFAIPISEGIWEIYTVEFDPRNEGDTLILTIAQEVPDPISLRAPN
jgi:hypothetical protein